MGKNAGAEELLTAIRRVSAGGYYLPPAVAERLSRGGSVTLTVREREVLQLMFRGLANRDIAGALGLSVGTVRIYVSSVLAKLSVQRRTEAVAVALERGRLQLG